MIKYLKTDTKGDLPIRISYSALKKFQEKTDKSLMDNEGLSNMLSGDLEHLLFYALQSGYKAEGKKLDLEFGDMENILDECMFEFIKLIPAFFPKSDEKSLSKSAGEKKK